MAIVMVQCGKDANARVSGVAQDVALTGGCCEAQGTLHFRTRRIPFSILFVLGNLERGIEMPQTPRE